MLLEFYPAYPLTFQKVACARNVTRNRKHLLHTNVKEDLSAGCEGHLRLIIGCPFPHRAGHISSQTI